jgi:general secretion pathway protein C
MPSRVSAFVIWALVAGGVVFWALRLGVHGPTAPAYTVPVGDAAVAHGDLSRLFGSAAAASSVAVAPEASSRFHLVGVAAPLADAPQGGGIALVSIDGKPARPFRVGARVEGDLLLRSVARRSATFGPASGETAFTLELPPRAAAATGTLPSLNAGLQVPPSESDEPVPPRDVPEVAPPAPLPNRVNPPAIR